MNTIMGIFGSMLDTANSGDDNNIKYTTTDNDDDNDNNNKNTQ